MTSRAPFMRVAVMRLLLDCKWHSTAEVNAVGGTEGTRRLRELRRSQSIDCRPSWDGGQWEYRLREEGE